MSEELHCFRKGQCFKVVLLHARMTPVFWFVFLKLCFYKLFCHRTQCDISEQKEQIGCCLQLLVELFLLLVEFLKVDENVISKLLNSRLDVIYARRLDILP